MSVSNVQIAKLALQNIGDRYDITDLSEASPEAEQVNLVFENCRASLLAEHPWKFAKAFYTPSRLVGTPPARWTYMFAYPPDAVKVWQIVNPLGRTMPPIKFDVLRNSDDTKVLVCEEQEPEFEYTKLITSASEYPPHFVWAFAWRLSALITMPLTGDPELKQMMERNAFNATEVAKTQDGNEGVEPEQTRDPDWIRARGGSDYGNDYWPWWR